MVASTIVWKVARSALASTAMISASAVTVRLPSRITSPIPTVSSRTASSPGRSAIGFGSPSRRSAASSERAVSASVLVHNGSAGVTTTTAVDSARAIPATVSSSMVRPWDPTTPARIRSAEEASRLLTRSCR